MHWTKALLPFALAAPLLGAERPAKNIIVFLGDAGGLATLNAASIYGYNEPRRLFLHTMPHVALSETSSATSWVTDSAAGMTAIVTGQRTHNGVLAQSAAAVRGKKDGEPLKTILEYAEERGLSTGVVSNSGMLSATPAACYAHVNDRKNLAAVFRELVNARFGDGVDVVIGAGRRATLAAAKEAGMNGPAALRKAAFEWHDSLEAIPAAARRVAVRRRVRSQCRRPARHRCAIAQSEGLLPHGGIGPSHRGHRAGARARRGF
jgi:alkaline phosphatase